MNCKPGDLAVVAVPPNGSYAPAYERPNLGRVFTVVRLAALADFPVPVSPYSFNKYGPIWVIEGSTYAWELYGEAVEWPLAPDSRLKPMRGEEGEDETLTWAGRPSDIKTPEAA